MYRRQCVLFLNVNLKYLYKSKRKRSCLSLGSLIKHFPPCVNHGGKGTVIGRRIPSVPLSCKITSDYSVTTGSY